MKLNSKLVTVGATLLLAAFGTVSAATNATARPAATQATCDSLIKQADAAVAAHGSAPKIAEAKKQRDAGEKACKAGNFAKGSEHLRRSLTDVGMKPVD